MNGMPLYRAKDKDIETFAKYFNVSMSMFSAKGQEFYIQNEYAGDDERWIVNGVNLDNITTPNGIIPLFLEEVSEISRVTNTQNESLPISYYKESQSMLGIAPEYHESAYEKPRAYLTIMLTTLDYILEKRLKESLKAKYGENYIENGDANKPVLVDISDIYNKFEEKYANQKLIVREEPRIVRNPNISKPKAVNANNSNMKASGAK